MVTFTLNCRASVTNWHLVYKPGATLIRVLLFFLRQDHSPLEAIKYHWIQTVPFLTPMRCPISVCRLAGCSQRFKTVAKYVHCSTNKFVFPLYVSINIIKLKNVSYQDALWAFQWAIPSIRWPVECLVIFSWYFHEIVTQILDIVVTKHVQSTTSIVLTPTKG